METFVGTSATPFVNEGGEVKNSTESNFEIVKLGNVGFEKKNSWFWFIFEWTIGWLLAEYIRVKSLKVALNCSNKPESFIDENGNGKDLILDRARQSFGPRRLKALFELRTFGFNASSPLLQDFCRHAAEAESLDDVYNAIGSFKWGGQSIYPISAPPDRWSNFYLDCPNGQSVRNRYRQVVKLYEQFGGGRTLSIACGSAQPIIHALHDLKARGQGEKTKLILTDVREESLALAFKRAEQAGVADCVNCERISFLRLTDHFINQSFDVVEACGILDYLADDRAIVLIKFALNALSDQGQIIISNMNRTRAANLLLKMYNWPIIYRTPEEFGQLIIKASGKNIKIYVEPWGIHLVATATR